MNVRTKMLSLLVVAAVAVTLTQASAQGRRAHLLASDAVWNAFCDYTSPPQQIDPVRNYGPGQKSKHLHAFFGHKTVTSTTSAGQLSSRSAGADLVNSCVKSDGTNRTPFITFPVTLSSPRAIDNSAYWAPLLSDGACVYDATIGVQTCPQPATPDYALIYYRSGSFTGDAINSMKPLPAGLQMMAGDPMKTGSTTGLTGHVMYTCLVGDHKGTPQNSIPDYCPDWGDDNTQFRMIVSFPNCIVRGWTGPTSGLVRDWNTSNNMAYSDQNGGQCPADGRTWDAIPQVEFGIRWELDSAFHDHLVNNTGQCNVDEPPTAQCYALGSAYLSSDNQSLLGMPPSGTDGATGHADFVNGWSAPDLTTVMRLCYWDELHNGWPGAGAPRQCGWDHDIPN